MRIIVVSSCTGEKTVGAPNQLEMRDFEKGPEHVRRRERELASLLVAAEDLYAGQQHVRLIRGIRSFRQAAGADASLDLWILSAGYGLVPADRKLAPYEATFQGMSRKRASAWADHLSVPAQFSLLLGQPYDLALVLLGDQYLGACRIEEAKFSGPTILVAGAGTSRGIAPAQHLRVITTATADTQRFGAPFVSLKGEIGARILARLATDASFAMALRDPGSDVLSALAASDTTKPTASAVTDSKRGKVIRLNPKVDQVIHISEKWKSLPHRKQLRYFIPEWKDMVDPDFDFVTEEHSGGRANWANEVYAHQMYGDPNYDGILVSRSVVDPPRKKSAKLSPSARRIYELGVHRMLRVPDDFEVMGDCGAFGYVKSKDPLYSTEDVVEYYTKARFNYGVSVDHLVLPHLDPREQRYRYDLTLQNAEAFLKAHGGQLPWTPIGAVQGWDPESYAAAAAALIEMGYRYIAIGAVAKRNDKYIQSVLRAVYPKVTSAPQHVDVHVLGVARLKLVPFYLEHGVTSMDSASSLRQAWIGAKDNYYGARRNYSALRIRDAHGAQADELVGGGTVTRARLVKLEKKCFSVLDRLGHGVSVKAAIRPLVEYESLFTGKPDLLKRHYQETLSDAPWANCGCPICDALKIQVAVWRGNNRNRRRGFHNTYVYYRKLQQTVTGRREEAPRSGQLMMF